jgi:hypothetical protein
MCIGKGRADASCVYKDFGKTSRLLYHDDRATTMNKQGRKDHFETLSLSTIHYGRNLQSFSAPGHEVSQPFGCSVRGFVGVEARVDAALCSHTPPDSKLPMGGRQVIWAQILFFPAIPQRLCAGTTSNLSTNGDLRGGTTVQPTLQNRAFKKLFPCVD